MKTVIYQRVPMYDKMKYFNSLVVKVIMTLMYTHAYTHFESILRIIHVMRYPICQAHSSINIPIFPLQFPVNNDRSQLTKKKKKRKRVIAAHKINQRRCLTYVSTRGFQLEDRSLFSTIHFQLLPNAWWISVQIKHQPLWNIVFCNTFRKYWIYLGTYNSYYRLINNRQLFPVFLFPVVMFLIYWRWI